MSTCCSVTTYLVMSVGVVLGEGAEAVVKPDRPEYLRRYKLANLVLEPTGKEGDFDGHAVECPMVFRHGGKWLMAYTAIAKQKEVLHEVIAMCESDDLIHWSHRRQILGPGKPDTFDHGGLSGPFVWFEGKRAYMTYVGFPRAGYESKPGQHGLAWSDDLKTWHKSPENPIHCVGSRGSWNDEILYKTFVMQRDGLYWMFYNAHGLRDNCEQIGVAISPNRVDWFEYERNPVLRRGDPKIHRDHVIIGDPWVMFLNGEWHMFYFAFDGEHARECLATSSDLLNWRKSPLNPIMDVGPPGSYDDIHCHKPCVMEHDGVFYHFFTACGKQEDGSEHRAIGLATSRRLPGVAYRDR